MSDAYAEFQGSWSTHFIFLHPDDFLLKALQFFRTLRGNLGVIKHNHLIVGITTAGIGAG
jgi:hypothetical protein